MELDEVAARVFRSYWPLLAVMTAVPLALVALLMNGREPAAVAESRLQAGSAAEAVSGDGSASIVVSQVQAFATSENLLSSVLAAERIDRPARKVAKAIKVSGLGTSTVVELSVRDRDPAVALRLTDAVGAEVVRQINEKNHGTIRRRIREIDKRVRKLEDRLGPLARQASGPVPDIGAANERERVQAELSDLRSNRSDLMTQLTASGTASVVQPAVLAPSRNPVIMMAAIAGLAGLVAGILVAVVTETLRPTIPGQRRVARRLGVPLLGRTGEGPAQLADLGRRIRLAARKEDVDRVALVGAPGPLPPELVSAVAAAVYGDDTKVVSVRPGHRGPGNGAPTQGEPGGDAGGDADGDAPSLNSGGPGGGSSTSVVRTGGGASAVATRPAGASPTEITQPVAVRRVCHVHAFEDVDPGADDTVGVVVAVGPVTTVAGLETVDDLVAASGWPLLGVVATSRKATSKRARRARKTKE